MKHTCFILVVVFLLFACATTTKYDAKLSSLMGADKAQVIQAFGAPSAVKMIPGGGEVIAYTKANDVYVPSEFYLYNQGALSNEFDGIYSPFLGDYDFSPYGDTFGYNVTEFCQTAFFLQDGKVNGWKWRGNDCLSD